MTRNLQAQRNTKQWKLLHASQQKKLQAKEKGGADPCNAWWCDVAGGGCTRPCEAHDYEPEVRFSYGDDYVTCEACFHAELTEEQQAALTRVEPS